MAEALGQGSLDVFNTDQGSQFTSQGFTRMLQDHGVKVSHDGKGRYQDNIFMERLWRTLKYEEVYLKAYVGSGEARKELGAYFSFYNDLRPHQSLGYRTPAEVFHGHPMAVEVERPSRQWLESQVIHPDSSVAGPSLNSAPILSG